MPKNRKGACRGTLSAGRLFCFFDCLIVEIDEFDAVEIAGDDFAGGQIL